MVVRRGRPKALTALSRGWPSKDLAARSTASSRGDTQPGRMASVLASISLAAEFRIIFAHFRLQVKSTLGPNGRLAHVERRMASNIPSLGVQQSVRPTRRSLRHHERRTICGASTRNSQPGLRTSTLNLAGLSRENDPVSESPTGSTPQCPAPTSLDVAAYPCATAAARNSRVPHSSSGRVRRKVP